MGYLGLTGPFGIIHRGGTDEHVENTLPAFQRALDLGFSVLETDLQATRDNVLVVSHDANLSRVSGIDVDITSVDFSELSELTAESMAPALRFEELLDTLPSDIRLNIDPKSDQVVVPLIRLFSQRPDLIERVCVGSFKAERLRLLRSSVRHLKTSLGVTEMRNFFLMHKARIGSRRFLPQGVIAVQIPEKFRSLQLVTRKFTEYVHDHDLDVHVWTVNEPHDMHRLYDLGVDAVMTDRPLALRSVLQQRGLWTRSK